MVTQPTPVVRQRGPLSGVPSPVHDDEVLHDDEVFHDAVVLHEVEAQKAGIAGFKVRAPSFDELAEDTEPDPEEVQPLIFEDGERVEEAWSKSANRFEADFANIETKIHRFPASLRGLGERYMAPTAVAIGPYHRPSASDEHLLEMESVKDVAAYHFVKESRNSQEEIYRAVCTVEEEARNTYTDKATRNMDRSLLAFTMFRDGCFLLQYMLMWTKPDKIAKSLLRFLTSNQAVISKDIMLLENQIPWVVIETLRGFRTVDVEEFIAKMGRTLQVRGDSERTQFVLDGYRPSHLLGLLHYYKTTKVVVDSSAGHQPMSTGVVDLVVASSAGNRPMPTGVVVASSAGHRPMSTGVVVDSSVGHRPMSTGVEVASSAGHRPMSTEVVVASSAEHRPMSKTISAIELQEMGIKLTHSKTTKFIDMGINKTLLAGEIFLAPLLLDEVRSCWLINMAAFEISMGMSMGTDAKEDIGQPVLVVCSYIAVLAMLMDREEDVHALRTKRLVQGELTNMEILHFFKTLIKHITPGTLYTHIMEDIEVYKLERRIWIKLHAFIYKNIKIIITVMTIISVIVGIFKTLLSLKRH